MKKQYTPITNNFYVKPNNQSPSHIFGLTTSPSQLGQFPPPNSSAPSAISSKTSEEKEWIFGSKYLEIIKKREKEEKEREENQKLIKDKMKGFCNNCISGEIEPLHLSYIMCGHKFCYDCILRRSLSDQTCPLCEQPFDQIHVAIKLIL
ncbi:hypothetical protein DICPUDRAFT_155682 [Dictyostelium purpureum]|uniref:RING-type domain-containing protein n=1 Tax=Dictyostelium purpureum TaxID=5786 RepID=F0ZUM4_DICPU|nr:uncharacterized protein DICPUDRAFT_155682 [Dictyostelium purpureum]EGC32359.1 hypothetical protein DICPUDRAFT_155682 [Dictyostelium purpureum]|eukprot:XP_003291124.1 hypothetical protein DICPUDRAFT_155682 [Dictyostelium purpureum]